MQILFPPWSLCAYDTRLPGSELSWLYHAGIPAGKGRNDILKHSTGRAHARFLPRTSWIHSRQALVTRYPLLFGSITGCIIIWVTQEWVNQQKHGYHFPHSLLQMPTVMPGPTRQKTKGRGAGGWACSTLLCPGDFRSHSAWVCDKLKYKNEEEDFWTVAKNPGVCFEIISSTTDHWVKFHWQTAIKPSSAWNLWFHQFWSSGYFIPNKKRIY